MVAGEPNAQIGNAAVIDVAVGAAQAPFPGVGGKGGAHVRVHQRLQVEREGVAVSADDDVGADALGARNIAAGKGEAGVGGIISEGDADLLARGGDQLGGTGRGVGLRRRGG